MKSTRILIIDDDGMSCEMLRHMLSDHFENFLIAGNGREGLDLLAVYRDVDVILLDLEMPVMGGREMLKVVRSTPELQAIAVIVVAGNREDALLSMATGADDFITKPYEKTELLLRVKSHLQRRVDFNKRQHIENLLRKNQENLNRAQSVAQTGSWTLDLLTGKVDWSAEAHRMFGIPEHEQITAIDFFSFIHHEDYSMVTSAWYEMLSSFDPYDIVYRIEIDGKVVWIRGRAQVEQSDGTYPLLVTGTIQDITELKESEIELKRRNDLVKEQRDQLESALNRIKQLEGIIPICSYCKKIRDKENSWLQLEAYISQHSDAVFSHGMCPDCFEEQVKQFKEKQSRSN